MVVRLRDELQQGQIDFQERGFSGSYTDSRERFLPTPYLLDNSTTKI